MRRAGATPRTTAAEDYM
ncbi:hypothetical protein A2U01_0095019, partial [Trifolium medium]|nr:hypothetical protein [Trifolium medium]